MSRRCMITGKSVMSGNNVSHAQNKTRRKFLPNVQDVNIYSEALSDYVKIRVSANGMRTLEHNGGLDLWIMSKAITKIDPDLRALRKRVEKALAKKTASK